MMVYLSVIFLNKNMHILCTHTHTHTTHRPIYIYIYIALLSFAFILYLLPYLSVCVCVCLHPSFLTSLVAYDSHCSYLALFTERCIPEGLPGPEWRARSLLFTAALGPVGGCGPVSPGNPQLMGIGDISSSLVYFLAPCRLLLAFVFILLSLPFKLIYFA